MIYLRIVESDIEGVIPAFTLRKREIPSFELHDKFVLAKLVHSAIPEQWPCIFLVIILRCCL